MVRPIGTKRRIRTWIFYNALPFLSKNKVAKVGRMAVLDNFRRTGIGSRVLLFLEKKAIEKKIEEISLHAQEYVMNFYKNHGYKERGSVFLEAGIKHIEMFKIIEK